MLYIENESHDPAFNLALEQHLFDTFEDDLFMFWRNTDTVVVGLHQNTAEEVDGDFLSRNNIPVVRRLSGGGAVFHDLGNINFSIIEKTADGSAPDFRRSASPIVDALAALGVNAVAGGRNDITAGGLKISGNARYLLAGRLMHHGTILFDVDFDKMSQALRPPKDKYASKGIQSVRARVGNLREYLPDLTTVEFLEFLRGYVVQNRRLTSYELTGKDLAAVETLRAARYSTWEWNWGKSPEYNVEKRRRIDGFGAITLKLKIAGGVIAGFDAAGDYFGTRPSAGLAAILTGVKLEARALYEKLSGVPFGEFFEGLSVNEFVRILVD
ncbi:MAG: lipoate--protein ligase [Defluviitaleaceae bacterium]|nr:lipoate--protein ligase [Defluviitaleaceae bacterium]